MLTTATFDRQYRDWNDAVLRWAQGIMRDDHAGEDAAQSAWMEAWLSREQFDGVRSFGSWLKTILRRVCWRMMNPPRNKPVPVVSIEGMSAEEWAEAEPRSEGEQEAHVEASQVREAIDSIKQDAVREAALLTMDGNTPTEIGRINGTTPQAATDALRRAVIQLRKRWGLA